MTTPPCWMYPEKQPGDYISASHTSSTLLMVHKLSKGTSTTSPRKWFLAHIIMPAVFAALILIAVIAFSAGLFQ